MKKSKNRLKKQKPIEKTKNQPRKRKSNNNPTSITKSSQNNEIAANTQFPGHGGCDFNAKKLKLIIVYTMPKQNVRFHQNKMSDSTKTKSQISQTSNIHNKTYAHTRAQLLLSNSDQRRRNMLGCSGCSTKAPKRMLRQNERRDRPSLQHQYRSFPYRGGGPVLQTRGIVQRSAK